MWDLDSCSPLVSMKREAGWPCAKDKATHGWQWQVRDGKELGPRCHYEATASSLSQRKAVLFGGFSVMKPINLLSCWRQLETGPLSHTVLRVLTDRPSLTETNWACLYPSQSETAKFIKYLMMFSRQFLIWHPGPLPWLLYFYFWQKTVKPRSMSLKCILCVSEKNLSAFLHYLTLE